MEAPSKKTSSSRRRAPVLSSTGLFLALVTLLGAGLRLVKLGDKPLWSAEIQEIFNARCHGFLANLRDAGSDVMGFLWHNLVWRLDLTPVEFWARVPGVIAGTAGVWVAWSWGRRFWGREAALVGAIAAACSVYLVDLSQTGRWYMAAAVCGNAASLWLHRALEEKDDRLLRLWPYWLAASVAVLSHAIAGVVLVVHLAIISIHELAVGRRGFRRWLLQCVRVFLPLLPALLIQLGAFVAFSEKMSYHPVVFLVGQGHSAAALLKTVPAVLSGGWTPLWLLFAAVGAVGGFALWQFDRRRGLVWLAALFIPPILIGGLVGVVGSHAFDVNFLCFLFAPAYCAFGVGLAALSRWASKRRWLSLAVYLVPLLVFVGSNGWLLKSYYTHSTKPVLGPDYRAVGTSLAEAEPSKGDYLFYRYGEHFSHLAFYAAQQLQQVNLVAQVVPEHSRDLLFEYLHRLNGCADRPRVSPKRVRQLSELGDDAQPRWGRVFVVLSCPARFGNETDRASSEAQPEPDYALWVLEKGVRDLSCSSVIDAFPNGWGIFQYAGAILAYQPAGGRSEKQLAHEVGTILSRLPNERLRLNPPRD